MMGKGRTSDGVRSLGRCDDVLSIARFGRFGRVERDDSRCPLSTMAFFLFAPSILYKTSVPLSTDDSLKRLTMETVQPETLALATLHSS